MELFITRPNPTSININQKVLYHHKISSYFEVEGTKAPSLQYLDGVRTQMSPITPSLTPHLSQGSPDHQPQDPSTPQGDFGASRSHRSQALGMTVLPAPATPGGPACVTAGSNLWPVPDDPILAGKVLKQIHRCTTAHAWVAVALYKQLFTILQQWRRYARSEGFQRLQREAPESEKAARRLPVKAVREAMSFDN